MTLTWLQYIKFCTGAEIMAQKSTVPHERANYSTYHFCTDEGERI